MESPGLHIHGLVKFLFALAERLYAMKGLLSLKLVLCFLYVFSSALAFAYIARDWFVAILLAALVVVGSSFHLSLRPQLIVWIVFPVFIAVLEHVKRTGFSVHKGIVLLLLTALWANNHITTVLAVLATFFWLWKERGIFLSLLSVLAGSLCTPYFGAEWLTFLNKSGHPLSYQLIAEFQAATILEFPTAFLMLSVFLMVMFVFYKGRELPVMPFLFSGVMIVAGLAVNKFIPFALIYICSLSALAWSIGKTEDFMSFGEGVERLRDLTQRVPAQGLSFVFLCFGIVNINRLYQMPVDEYIVPKAAFDFYEQHKLPSPLLNDFGRGGYVMYRRSDEKGMVEEKVPVDGRTNVTPIDIWVKFQASFEGMRNWEEFVELTNANTVLWSMASPFGNLLLASGEWCLVFQQGQGASGYGLFVRQSAIESRDKLLSHCFAR